MLVKSKVNNEKHDVFNLIHSMSNSELRHFRAYVKKHKTDSEAIYLTLFEKMIRQKEYDELDLIQTLQLSETRLRDAKSYLFKVLLESLRFGGENESILQLHREVMELNILSKKGLIRKVKRKFKKIKKLAEETGSYSLLADAHNSIYAIATPLEVSNYSVNKQRIKISKEHNHYLELALNLNQYRILENEVLETIYKTHNGRTAYKQLTLDFLSHRLLSGEHMAKSEKARYLYFQIISLIYSGVNDFKNANYYAKKCVEHCLSSGLKPVYYNPIIASYHNYIYFALRMGDLSAYEQEYQKYKRILDELSSKVGFSQKAKIFENKADLQLTYLWTKRDYEGLQKISGELFEGYHRYRELLSPDYHVEILLGISRLHLFSGQVEEALDWCNRLMEIQRKNPVTSMLIAGNILRIIVYCEMGDFKIIPHLTSSTEYFIKSRNRYFLSEQTFLRRINKIRVFHSKKEKQIQLRELHEELKSIWKDKNESYISEMIGLEEWLESKY